MRSIHFLFIITAREMFSCSPAEQSIPRRDSFEVVLNSHFREFRHSCAETLRLQGGMNKQERLNAITVRMRLEKEEHKIIEEKWHRRQQRVRNAERAGVPPPPTAFIRAAHPRTAQGGTTRRRLPTCPTMASTTRRTWSATATSGPACPRSPRSRPSSPAPSPPPSSATSAAI